MTVRDLLDVMEPLTDTLARLPDETEAVAFQICDTRYDVLVSLELSPEDKPGEAIQYAAQNLRKEVLTIKMEHPVWRKPAMKHFFLHNAGDAFIEFCEYEGLKDGASSSDGA